MPDAVSTSPSVSLPSTSNRQELDAVTLEPCTHFGERGGLPGALCLPGMLWEAGLLY